MENVCERQAGTGDVPTGNATGAPRGGDAPIMNQLEKPAPS